MRLKKFSAHIGIIACLAMGSPVIAGPLDDGLTAYEAGKMEKAFNHFMAAATSGDAEGQYYIGLMYFEGVGVNQSNNIAGNWFEKSARQNNTNAMTWLGAMYEDGMGRPFSVSTAQYWYKKAASDGDEDAIFGLNRLNTQDPDEQLDLANKYASGDGAMINKKLAAYWYEKSALQGNETAMSYFGQMLETGDGIAMDKAAALDWYDKATALGNWVAGDMATALRAKMKQDISLQAGNTKPDGYYDSEPQTENGAPSNKLPEGFSIYQPSEQNSPTPVTQPVDTLALLTAKAESGDVDAQEKLGLMYYHGDTVAQSYEKAKPWLDKAAIERRMDAMMAYANMFDKGLGVRQEDWAAKLWYEEAAKKGNTQAAKWLKAYTESLGASAPTIVKVVPKYKPMPSIVLDQAYSQGTLTAADRKLQTFKHDEGVRLSNQGEYSLARLNWKPYAEAGIVRFQFNMGHSYLAEKDFANALLWFKRAASAPTVDTNYFKIAEAQFRIGLAYVAGDGVEADPTTAAAWFHLAVDHLVPNDKAEEMLGLMYYEGTGVPADRSNAIKYLRGADSSETWVMLGLLLEEGYQGFTWPKEAVKYYEKAANKGIADGQYLLGMRYAEGEHLPENIGLAKKWLKKAADQGHGKAEAKLTELAAQ